MLKIIWVKARHTARRAKARDHAHSLYRRRPGRSLSGPADEAPAPGACHHGRRAQQALRYVRLGRRVLGCHDVRDAPCRPQSAAEIEDAFNHWDDIELVFKGTRQRTTGHGFIGIGRKHLLNILQRRCEALGVELVFEREVESDLEYPDADLIVACDGVNSRIRARYAEQFQPDMVIRPNRFIWLGTKKAFDAFTFDFQKTEHGWFQAHIYKFDAETSTFIVETTEEAYNAHGLGELDQQASIEFCEKIFAETLDGAKLLTNARHLRGSAWLNFSRLICGKWSVFNGKSHVVLMGDAAHTAHFAIGSGTKLALDDAIELANQFDRHGHGRAGIETVLDAYEEVRRVDVARIQNAARNAMEWFEVVGHRYADTLEPPQFFYSMLTRSQRISHENLRAARPLLAGRL